MRSAWETGYMEQVKGAASLCDRGDPSAVRGRWTPESSNLLHPLVRGWGGVAGHQSVLLALLTEKKHHYCTYVMDFTSCLDAEGACRIYVGSLYVGGLLTAEPVPSQCVCMGACLMGAKSTPSVPCGNREGMKLIVSLFCPMMCGNAQAQSPARPQHTVSPHTRGPSATHCNSFTHTVSIGTALTAPCAPCTAMAISPLWALIRPPVFHI